VHFQWPTSDTDIELLRDHTGRAHHFARLFLSPPENGHGQWPASDSDIASATATVRVRQSMAAPASDSSALATGSQSALSLKRRRTSTSGTSGSIYEALANAARGRGSQSTAMRTALRDGLSRHEQQQLANERVSAVTSGRYNLQCTGASLSGAFNTLVAVFDASLPGSRRLEKRDSFTLYPKEAIVAALDDPELCRSSATVVRSDGGDTLGLDRLAEVSTLLCARWLADLLRCDIANTPAHFACSSPHSFGTLSGTAL